jgi:hypothetical protein
MLPHQTDPLLSESTEELCKRARRACTASAALVAGTHQRLAELDARMLGRTIGRADATASKDASAGRDEEEGAAPRI